MRLLLDTHVWLWRLLEPDRVPAEIESVLRESDNELFLSPVSVWETMVLARRGRLVLQPAPAEWVGEALRSSPTMMAPLTHAVALRAEQLPGFPSADPADRFLAATALESELTLVTVDEALLGYARLPTLTGR